MAEKNNKIRRNDKEYEITIVEGRYYGIYEDGIEVERIPIDFRNILLDWLVEHIKEK